MKSSSLNHSRALMGVSLLLGLLSGCAQMGNTAGMPMGDNLSLSGSQEVPPVTTMAVGTGQIRVMADGSISGNITTTGVPGTMAHIHLGARGANGPVIIPLTGTSPGVWSVPAGAKLNAEQLDAYQAGKLYVNVHSEMNKGGEIRAQLMP